MFIGLNPSTADETEDDPTIRRCISFARDWGYGGVFMLNLFAFRATVPSDMFKAKNPIGPLNDSRLEFFSEQCEQVVAAWGVHGAHQERGKRVSAFPCFHGKLFCLGTTKQGHPRHPLYLKRDTKLEAFGYERKVG